MKNENKQKNSIEENKNIKNATFAIIKTNTFSIGKH